MQSDDTIKCEDINYKDIKKYKPKITREGSSDIDYDIVQLFK